MSLPPWNQNLWVFSRTKNYNPANVSLIHQHRFKFVPFFYRTSQETSSTTRNPLLIVQTTGPPSKETERYNNFLCMFVFAISNQLLCHVHLLLFTIFFRTVPTATIQGGGNSKSPDLEKFEEENFEEYEDLISDEEQDGIRITPIKSQKRTINPESETNKDNSEKAEPPKKKKKDNYFNTWNTY